jgi:hypothetical protein
MRADDIKIGKMETGRRFKFVCRLSLKRLETLIEGETCQVFLKP